VSPPSDTQAPAGTTNASSGENASGMSEPNVSNASTPANGTATKKAKAPSQAPPVALGNGTDAPSEETLAPSNDTAAVAGTAAPEEDVTEVSPPSDTQAPAGTTNASSGENASGMSEPNASGNGTDAPSTVADRPKRRSSGEGKSGSSAAREVDVTKVVKPIDTPPEPASIPKQRRRTTSSPPAQSAAKRAIAVSTTLPPSTTSAATATTPPKSTRGDTPVGEKSQAHRRAGPALLGVFALLAALAVASGSVVA